METEREGTIETTLGDLILALTEETAPFVRNEKEIYRLVAFILRDLFTYQARFLGRRA